MTLQPKKTMYIKTKSAAIAFFFFSSFLSPCSFYFPFPCSFPGQEDFRAHFAFGQHFVFFSVERLQFAFGRFSKIQQDYVLAFTVTYTLIFINVPTSSNICFTFLNSNLTRVLLNLNWRGGENSFINSLRCTTMQREMRFHLRKSAVTFAPPKKLIKVNGTFIA